MMFRVLTLTLAFLALALPLRADPNLKVALAQLRANDPGAARAAMARVDDPVLRDVVMWHLLRGRHGTFPEAVAFLERNADWPGLPLLRTRVEASIPATTGPDALLSFFAEEPPRTSRATLLHALALRQVGRVDEAEFAIISFWLEKPASASSHAGFVELFGETLAPFHAARLDAMAWSGNTESAERTLPLVSGAEVDLARARIALRDDRDGVNALIDAVPADLRDHPGLAYERFRWRLNKGLRDRALELLFAYDESADTLANPEAWAQHRLRLARGLKQDGQPADAYRVAAAHHLEDGTEDIAQLEWLAGYLALRFQNDAPRAVDHFRRFGANVRSPISKGRAGYWLGRALEAAGDPVAAQAAYAEGAGYQTSFYGQLAAERAAIPTNPLLTGSEVFPPLAETPLASSTVYRAAEGLHRIGERSLAERFMAHLAEGKPRAQIGALIDRALSWEEPHIALMIAKRAATEGHEMYEGYFPVTDLAELPSPVAPELSLAIARRESEFDPVVVSGAGARGLMQLMPGTAQEMSNLLGLEYAQSKLTADPLYNARLGTTYLGELEGEFGQSLILVPAAYNAGPSRARAWTARFGDPTNPSVDLVDWIEDVPFSETRNYIMRVSESLLPYSARLTGQTGQVALSRWLREGYGDLVRGNGG
ncbi:MAG: lytic transglycosylase domain-containing protein [Pseudomonadota bacterium]